MKALVIGGTGTVGSQVARDLKARGAEVLILTRSAEKVKSLPAGTRGIVGDLLDPGTVRTIFRGVDGVFLLNVVSPAETHEGLMAVNGARMAGVRRLVYLSVQDADRAAHLPHFGSKHLVEIVIKTSGIPYTILRPNNFFQNDYYFKDALLQHGVYPQPIGDVGVSRVDIRDIAEAAAIALTGGGHEGQTFNIVGAEPFTGKSTADAWGRALGRPVAYAGNDLDAWEEQSLQYSPPHLVFDFRLMYEYFQKEGFKATKTDLERQTKLLGHAPRTFEDFAREAAQAWAAPTVSGS
jgi:uncharacterized protein YbjT (DUF2867 family)